MLSGSSLTQRRSDQSECLTVFRLVCFPASHSQWKSSSARFSKNENEARNIENRLREFHRLGYIKPQRQQLRVTWIATASGKAKLDEEQR